MKPRKAKITIRMTEDERSALQQMAFDNGTTMQELCVSKLFPNKPPAEPPAEPPIRKEMRNRLRYTNPPHYR